MGKCSLCGKKVLGRRRKCNSCKSSKKKTRNTNETFISNTFSINNEKKTDEIDKEENDKKDEETNLNETFIDQLMELNISDNDFAETSSETTEGQEDNVCYEIDSILVTLNKYNIPIEDGNLTIYTDPKIFKVKNNIFLKIGWIFFLNSGLQCNILTKYTDQWKLSYSQTISNIEEQYKKFFLKMLPINMDKIVYNTHINIFLASLINTVDNEVFLYGKGLKCIINTQYIRNLLYSVTKNISSGGRIDIAKSLYDNIEMKFDIDKFKQVIQDYTNYEISKLRIFSQQYGECNSIVATIKQCGTTIGDITCYYHNSIIYRKFFENRKFVIPSILGKNISDKCKIDYISKNNLIETLNDIAYNCVNSVLIRRIEFRIINFDHIEEFLNFFDFVIKNNDLISINVSMNFEYNFNMIFFYINCYEKNNLLSDQILWEEIIRVFFLGLDSDVKNNFVDTSNLKLLLIDLRTKYSQYVSNCILSYEINFSYTDGLVLKRIFNSFCKDKQFFSIFRYICAGYSNDGFDIAKNLIRKIFMKQLLLDYLLTCKNLTSNKYSFFPVKFDNDYDITLFLRVNKVFDSSTSNLTVLSTLIYNMGQDNLPEPNLIGDCNVLRIRNREFNSKYTYNDYSKLLMDNFININENLVGFHNSQVIIQIIYVLFKYINEYTWGNIYDVFEEFCDYVSEFLFENKIKMFPLYNFTKIHTQNKNCYQWVQLCDNDKLSSEVDLLSLVFNNLDFTSGNNFIEPFEIYDSIINTSTNSIACYRLPNVTSDIIFENYIQKINTNFSKSVWETSIAINRSLILKNKEIYIRILSFMISNKVKNLSIKVSRNKYILALRYLMYVSGSIFMKRVGILTKGIRKEEIKTILPIFEEQKSRNSFLIIDEEKLTNFNEMLIKLSN